MVTRVVRLPFVHCDLRSPATNALIGAVVVHNLDGCGCRPRAPAGSSSAPQVAGAAWPSSSAWSSSSVFGAPVVVVYGLAAAAHRVGSCPRCAALD